MFQFSLNIKGAEYLQLHLQLQILDLKFEKVFLYTHLYINIQKYTQLQE
jgi:hypothetical protein